jgi:hypothetical protein
VTPFLFDKHRSKSFVPHWQFTEQNNNLKQVSPQSRRIYVPMLNTAGGGNTPHIGVGYYRVQLCGALAHNFFAVLAKEKDFHQSIIRQSHSRKQGDTFHFDEYKIKSLIPYRQPRERYISLKKETFQSLQICV